ncbi:MAG: TolC family outer membrane protein [Gammaproteobacteria bacterium]
MTDYRSRPRHAGRFPRSFIGAAMLVALVCGAPGSTLAITLEDAVEQALASNPTVLQAEAEMRAAGHDVRQARAGYFPSLDLDTRYGREHTNIKQLSVAGNDVDDLWRRESGLTVTQLLWDGNATRSEVHRRVSLLNSAEHSLADTRNALAFRAAEAYLDVLRNRELVELARGNAESHARTLENVRAKFKSGVGNKADVEQATARLALAHSTVAAREGALLEAQARYERVVGDAPSADLARPQVGPSGLVKAGAVDPAELSTATDSAQQRALSDHPLVLQSTADVEAAQAAIKAARAGYHPQINLEGSLRRDNNLAGVAGNRNADALMVVARWNLFRGGADRARELAAAERKVSAQDQLEDAMRRIAENVAIAYQARATSESRITYLGQHVASSEGTLQAYRAQFELNRRTLLDVLNAENELFNARSNLVIGTYDDIVNSYFVDASVGSLASRFGGAGTP